MGDGANGTLGFGAGNAFARITQVHGVRFRILQIGPEKLRGGVGVFREVQMFAKRNRTAPVFLRLEGVAGTSGSMILQRKAIRMLERIQRQLYIEILPAQEASMDQFDVVDLREARILKPGKLLVR